MTYILFLLSGIVTGFLITLWIQGIAKFEKDRNNLIKDFDLDKKG